MRLIMELVFSIQQSWCDSDGIRQLACWITFRYIICESVWIWIIQLSICFSFFKWKKRLKA